MGIVGTLHAVRPAVNAAWVPPPASPSVSSSHEVALARRVIAARLVSSMVAISVAAGGPLQEAANAISGGGKDYATQKLSGNFHGGDYSNKDFSGCQAPGLDFSQSKFKGSRFFKADLNDVNFSGSDLTGATLEQADLVNANFEGAKLDRAYFTDNILGVQNLKGATLTDAVMPTKVLQQVCQRPDVQEDPATLESLMCP